MAIKDLNSNSWFSDCRRFLHKYGLPNIYILDTQIESLEGWRALLKRHIDSFIENKLRQTDKSSLRFLNVKTLSVRKVHHSWLSVLNHTKAVKRAYLKIRLLSSTYILQENRARFNQYVVNTCCPLCGTGLRTVCTFWQYAQSLQRADMALWLNWAQYCAPKTLSLI